MATQAQELFGSSRMTELVKNLKNEVLASAEKINGVRAAQKELAQPYKAYIENLQVLRGRNLFYPYVGSGLGHGPYVELDDGSVKIDLINGIGIHLFGHAHPALLDAAIRASVQDIVMQGNLQPNKEYAALLETLLTAAGRKSRLKRGWIGTCGTIVNENALKIARQKNTPARKIIAMQNNFAGRSTLMAEITDNPEYKVGLPKYDDVLYIPFYDKHDPQSIVKSVNAMRAHIDANPKAIAAFMFEFVQGEGGFNVAPREYFVPLFELCRAHKIAIWADEIQTFARTGELFAFETLDLGDYIDIVTMAKTIQCGAILYTDEYNPKPGLIAGTFTASTVSLATGNRSMRLLLGENVEGGGGPAQKFLGPDGRIQQIYRDFVAMLTDLQTGSCKGLIKEVSGLGLMISMTPYDGKKEQVSKLLPALFNNGLIAFSCGHDPYKVRFLVPAVIESKHIAEVKQVLEKTLKENAGH